MVSQEILHRASINKAIDLVGGKVALTLLVERLREPDQSLQRLIGTHAKTIAAAFERGCYRADDHLRIRYLEEQFSTQGEIAKELGMDRSGWSRPATSRLLTSSMRQRITDVYGHKKRFLADEDTFWASGCIEVIQVVRAQVLLEPFDDILSREHFEIMSVTFTRDDWTDALYNGQLSDILRIGTEILITVHRHLDSSLPRRVRDPLEVAVLFRKWSQAFAFSMIAISKFTA